MLVQEYLNIFIFLFVSLALSIILLFVAYLAAPRVIYLEKVTTYECGFKPFSDSRMRFSIHFYLVAILFLIFDLEVAFMFPWAVALDRFGSTEIFSMLFFLYILVVGFIYEWRKGGMDW